MNENERINETNVYETVNVQDTPDVLPTENDMTARAATVVPAADEALPNGCEAREDSLNTCDTPEATAACAVCNGDETEQPETFLDRVLDAVFFVWDAFLDLLIALHILEEALPEQENVQTPVTAEADPAGSIFSVELVPEGSYVSPAVPSVPLPAAC